VVEVEGQDVVVAEQHRYYSRKKTMPMLSLSFDATFHEEKQLVVERAS